MRGLALEGGGSRGAYHIGAVQAYLENGYSFDGFAGTSIGAINAALLAQGDFEKALALWKSMSMERLFDADIEKLLKIGEIKLGMNFLTNLTNSIKKVVEDGGIDTSKIRTILEKIIDEEKLRTSAKEYGLVSVSVQERKPYEWFIEDIPQGELLNYIMASACFPGFQHAIIGDKPYVDGGLYNNCPINMLLHKGYDEIIAIRTHGPGIYRNFKPGSTRVTVIESREDLGNVLLFSQEQIERNIRIGYYDGLRAIHGLRGREYYIVPDKEKLPEERLLAIEESVILEAGKQLGLPSMPYKRMLFEQMIPQLGSYLKLQKEFDYMDFVIALLEHTAAQAKIERYQVYEYEEFVRVISKTPVAEEKKRGVDLLFALLPVKDKYANAIQCLLPSILST